MTYEPRAGRFRGVLRLLLALVFGVPLGVLAAGEITEYRFDYRQAWASTSAAACSSYQSVIQADNPSFTISTVAVAPSHCRITYVLTSNGSTYQVTTVGPAATRISCPSGSTLSAGVCVPAFPDLCAAKVGTSAGDYSAPFSGSSLSGDATFTHLCEPVSGSSLPGCGLTVAYDFAAAGSKTGRATFTGQGCTPDATSDGSAAGGTAPASGTGSTPVPGAPAPTPCKSGTFPGSVNGVSVCVPPSGTGPVESKTTKDSGSTNDGVPTPSVKEEKSTKCVGSTCTTTTTTTTTQPTVGGVPGAVTVTVGTATEGKSGVCTTDPKNPVCAGEGASDCPEDSTSIGCMKLGTPSDGVLSKVTKNIGVAGVDSLDGFAIGHACPADLTFDVMGRPQHMSFAGACDAAPLVKPLVVLAAAIAALFIVYAALTQKT